MAVTIPAITKPMTKSEKIMLRQLWPPSAYVRSCEQRQRSSSSAIDRSILRFLRLYQMHKPACNPREDGEERTFTIKTHGPCTMDNWFVSRLSVLFFFYQIPALTFLPLLSQLRFTETLFLQFVNLFYLIIRIIRCELDINLTPFVSFLAKFEQILV